MRQCHHWAGKHGLRARRLTSRRARRRVRGLADGSAGSDGCLTGSVAGCWADASADDGCSADGLTGELGGHATSVGISAGLSAGLSGPLRTGCSPLTPPSRALADGCVCPKERHRTAVRLQAADGHIRGVSAFITHGAPTRRFATATI